LSSNAASPFPGAYGVNVHDNIIMRTLPAVAKYSDWGFGVPFISTGAAADDEVTESALRLRDCIFISSGIIGFNIHDNYLSNAGTGVAITGTGTNQSTEGQIHHNHFYDCIERGISHAGSPTNLHVAIDINHNIFNLDPYCVATGRNVNGTWSGATVTCYGIAIPNARGVVVKDNTFLNCFNPIQSPGRFIVRNNILKSQAVGADGWNANSKGIGTTPRAGVGFDYVHINATPAAGDNFNNVDGDPRREAAAMPTTGTFRPGELIQNTDHTANPDVYGWVRITTGTNHVLDTDWKALRFS
jgi:hypothetical protein